MYCDDPNYFFFQMIIFLIFHKLLIKHYFENVDVFTFGRVVLKLIDHVPILYNFLKISNFKCKYNRFEKKN